MFDEMSQETNEEDLLAAFSIFDINNDDFVSPAEIQVLFQKLGQTVTIDDAMNIMRDCDVNKDGLIDFQGIFLYLCLNVSFK